MTIERRLTSLEGSLTPTGLVLRWLDEAHAFGDLASYISWLIDQPSSAAPLARLAREAADRARAAMRGKVGEQVAKAVRRSLRETVFRFELVMRVNVTALEMLDKEVLVHAALVGQLGMLVFEDQPEQLADPGHRQRLASCRDLTSLRVTELRAAREARSIVEARYLDGHPALFPDAVRRWDEQLGSTLNLADLASRLAELDEVGPGQPLDPEPVSARTALLLADLVEPAKASALDKLGESQRAIEIATGWFRGKTAPQGRAVDGAA